MKGFIEFKALMEGTPEVQEYTQCIAVDSLESFCDVSTLPEEYQGILPAKGTRIALTLKGNKQAIYSSTDYNTFRDLVRYAAGAN